MNSVLTEPGLQAHQSISESASTRRRPLFRHLASVLVLLWFLSGVYVVRPDEQAVITHFGAVAAQRVFPGIHFAWPWPFGSVYKVKVHQLQRLVIGGDVADAVLGRIQPFASQFLTGDQNIIHMRVVVQYSVAVPADYLFRSSDVPRSVGANIEAELARHVARRGVDAVLTTEKVAIQDESLVGAQKRLNDSHCGVELSTVNIETIAPPPEAADAFRDVASARADTGRIVDEAHGYANAVVPRARGEARQMTESAEAYRQSKINEANGDAARFNAIAAEYVKAAEVTSKRLYLEAMEQVLPKIRKLMLDSKSNVDLSIIRKGEPATKP